MLSIGLESFGLWRGAANPQLRCLGPYIQAYNVKISRNSFKGFQSSMLRNT